MFLCSPAIAQEGRSDELDALREEIRLMRAEYETRIAGLEARLDAAERAASQPPPGPGARAAEPVAENMAAESYQSPQTVSVARDSA